ncbi:DUF551 domain-containing protein [Mangrovibacter phragmitis]|uniref:DUF551 domain-containing protein n=1 Tax=Mangrovibacter phragmitis TaxID=1691903 RepID=UPI00351178AA
MQWISVKEKLPEQNCWVLVSTNMGIGIAQYNQVFTEWGYVSLTSLRQSTVIKILHWAELPEAPAGDFDPDAGGFQKQVKLY